MLGVPGRPLTVLTAASALFATPSAVHPLRPRDPPRGPRPAARHKCPSSRTVLPSSSQPIAAMTTQSRCFRRRPWGAAAPSPPASGSEPARRRRARRRGTVRRLERSDFWPRPDTLLRLADAVGVGAEALIVPPEEGGALPFPPPPQHLRALSVWLRRLAEQAAAGAITAGPASARGTQAPTGYDGANGRHARRRSGPTDASIRSKADINPSDEVRAWPRRSLR